FIGVIAGLLVLICAFYLSFTFVTRNYEKKAELYAQSQANTTDVADSQYKSYYKAYLDSIAKEKVYLNYYTFQQAREMEVGLGLDLKGGMNITLQVSVPEVLKALSNQNEDPGFNRAIFVTDSLLRRGKVGADVVGEFCRQYQAVAPQGSLAQIFRNVEKIKANPAATNAQVEAILKDEVSAMIENSYNVLRTRIDRFGVVAPNIQKLERDGQILLELPGVKEPERVSKLLQGTANLEFYETYQFEEIANAIQQLSAALAEKENMKAAAAAGEGDSTAAAVAQAPTLIALLNGGGQAAVMGTVAVSDTAAVNAMLASEETRRLLPSNLMPRWTVKAMDDNGKYFQLIALKTVSGKPALSGDVIVDAEQTFNQNQRPVVSMTMNNEGGRKWGRITGSNIGKSVAILLDDQVYSFPTVNSAIEDGKSEISGNFTIEDAKDLANVLKSGKMVARVEIIGNSVIGPSLGQQAIERGFISFIVALVLLMIFMCCIYGVAPGLIANMCLVLNLFFVLGILASLQAVLTLSGICGIVLSLGMAVDANVLIYERAKEELRAGKGLKAAVNDGYKNAFSAIFDSNLTSIITGVILLIYGTGPIKGFATTLIIGIVCSFFTAVFVSRLVLEGLLNKGKLQNITFSTKFTKNLWTNAKYNFIGAAKKTAIAVGVILVIVTASLCIRQLNPGIDFSGGRNYIVQFDHSVKTNDLQTKLAQNFEDASISVITIDNDTRVRISTNYMIDSNDPNVDEVIMDKLYNGLSEELNGMSVEDFSTANESVGVVSAEKVGPSIAKDITRGAIWAVALSLLAMSLYIFIRFNNVAFSLG
ncbi:MAG: protein translocase subunit SecD, partial [Muribaculaceae bacterium]|nr:protein translocase subunit SecD [Muribaculaceae bacterium]